MSVSDRSSLIFVLSIAALSLPLAGCEDFDRAIGREKVVPDEFAVVSRAPLAIPPDYSLRPPRIGVDRPQETAPVDQARQTVFRAGAPQESLPPAADQRSPGESEFLKQVGAGDAPTNIRQLVDQEANGPNQMSDSFVDKLAFWRSPEKKLGPTDNVIDPSAEEQRLSDAREATASPDAAASPGLSGKPTIERTGTEASSTKSSSWFGWLGKLF